MASRSIIIGYTCAWLMTSSITQVYNKEALNQGVSVVNLVFGQMLLGSLVFIISNIPNLFQKDKCGYSSVPQDDGFELEQPQRNKRTSSKLPSLSSKGFMKRIVLGCIIGFGNTTCHICTRREETWRPATVVGSIC